MTLRLPRLNSNESIVDGNTGRALLGLQRLWDQFATAIETSVSAIGLTGFVVSDGTNAVSRSIAGGTGITVTNGDGQAGNPTVAITATAVAAGSYGDATHVPAIAVNARGQLTSAVSTSITYPVTSVAAKTGAVTLVKADVGLGSVSNKAQMPLDGTDPMTAPITLMSYTVAGLPAVGAAKLAYASNGRKNGEGAGLGTGVLVFSDATAWRACDTGATVAA